MMNFGLFFRRELMKQQIGGHKSSIRGSRKSNTLLCARKNLKKKKRRKLGLNVNDDGFPAYPTTSIDGNYQSVYHGSRF